VIFPPLCAHLAALAFRIAGLYRSPACLAFRDGKRTDENVGADGRNESRDQDSDADLKARLEKLSHTLDAHRGGSSGPGGQNGAGGSGSSLGAATNLGFQALVEFVTAIVVGPIIGWQIDSWLKTKPIFFIVFLFVGMAAGLVNVYRLAVRSERQKRDGE